MDAARNFVTQSYLSYRGLFHWLTPFPYISNVVLAPFLTLLNFILVGRFAGDSSPDRFGVGMIAYAIVWIYMGGITQSFANDRQGGTLDLLLGSDANRAAAYFSRGAGHFYNGPLTAVCTTILGVLIIDLDVENLNVLTYLVAICAISLGVLSLALLIGNFAALYREWFLAMSIPVGGLLTLTGMVIPVGKLPPGLEQIGQVLPITHGLRALRGAFEGAAVSDVWEQLVYELIIVVALSALGLAVFGWMSREARRRGILA